jgi:hypothetical protein
VLRNKSACLGVTPSVTGHSQEKQSRYYGNSPEMINEPGGPPRTKNTSHLGLRFNLRKISFWLISRFSGQPGGLRVIVFSR